MFAKWRNREKISKREEIERLCEIPSRVKSGCVIRESKYSALFG